MSLTKFRKQTSEKSRRTKTEYLPAFVNESVGKDTPRKKPNIIPTKVVIISLIVSFVLLNCQPLQKARNIVTVDSSSPTIQSIHNLKEEKNDS